MMRNLFGGGSSGLPGFLGNISNVVKLFGNFVRNPFGALMSLGLDIPQNLNGNPEGMVNYLRSSGRMNDQDFNQCRDLAEQIQPFLGRRS